MYMSLLYMFKVAATMPRDYGAWKNSNIQCLSQGQYPASSNYAKDVNILANESQKWTGITSFPVIKRFESTYCLFQMIVTLIVFSNIYF